MSELTPITLERPAGSSATGALVGVVPAVIGLFQADHLAGKLLVICAPVIAIAVQSAMSWMVFTNDMRRRMKWRARAIQDYSERLADAQISDDDREFFRTARAELLRQIAEDYDTRLRRLRPLDRQR